MPALLKGIRNRSDTFNKQFADDVAANEIIIDCPSAVHKIVISIEKKIRNLEKRKNKLKQTECDLKAGKILIDDQKKAVQQLNQVETQIDFAREILRSVLQVASADKAARNNDRSADNSDGYENCQETNHDVQKLLTIQDALHCLGKSEVRRKFLNGLEGAMKLTDDQLALLDEAYRKLCPVRYSFMDRNEWNWSVSESVKFIHSLLGYSRSICFKNITCSSDSGVSVSAPASPDNTADGSSYRHQSPKNDIHILDLEQSNYVDVDTVNLLSHNVHLMQIEDDFANQTGVSSEISDLSSIPSALCPSLPQIFYAPPPSMVTMIGNTAILENTCNANNIIEASLPRTFPSLPQMSLAQIPPVYAMEQPLQIVPITQIPLIGLHVQDENEVTYDSELVEADDDAAWIKDAECIMLEESPCRESLRASIFAPALENSKPLNPFAPEFVSKLSNPTKSKRTGHSDLMEDATCKSSTRVPDIQASC